MNVNNDSKAQEAPDPMMWNGSHPPGIWGFSHTKPVKALLVLSPGGSIIKLNHYGQPILFSQILSLLPNYNVYGKNLIGSLSSDWPSPCPNLQSTVYIRLGIF